MRIHSIVLALLAAVLLLAPPARALSGPAPASAVVAVQGSGQEAGAHAGAAGQEQWSPPVWAVIPFVLMLLCIALIPLINEHWWENDRNRGLISLVLGLPVLIFSKEVAGWHPLLHTGEEYVSFIVLLGSLYVISGGIVITGNLKGTPLINTAFLAAGGLLASFIGTTGAAMLLIRPVLSTNIERHRVLHTVIFFIFIVCNCGGCLTPLGDPPLFLGYLKGVPFGWTFSLVPEWALVLAVLLAIYFVLDVIQHAREAPSDIKRDVEHVRPIVVRGGHNFLFLGGVVLSVALTSVFSFPSREGFMLLMAALAWMTTKAENREYNHFSIAPIREVAVVFFGIFSTMIPALAYLNTHGSDFGLETSRQFFWVTGALSSVLDNAPTYVSFLELADGIQHWAGHFAADAIGFAAGHDAAYGSLDAVTAAMQQLPLGATKAFEIPNLILRSISLGAVFMGAMTYIGNGPNFMVRAIATRAGVKMPSFFGYIVWSAVFLLPVFFVTTLIFL